MANLQALLFSGHAVAIVGKYRRITYELKPTHLWAWGSSHHAAWRYSDDGVLLATILGTRVETCFLEGLGLTCDLLAARLVLQEFRHVQAQTRSQRNQPFLYRPQAGAAGDGRAGSRGLMNLRRRWRWRWVPSRAPSWLRAYAVQSKPIATIFPDIPTYCTWVRPHPRPL